MTVSTHDLAPLLRAPVRPGHPERPGLRDWIAALAWMAALVAAHLLLFVVVIVLMGLG